MNVIVVWSSSGEVVAEQEINSGIRHARAQVALGVAAPLSGSFPAVASRWLVSTGRGVLHLLESGEAIAVTSRRAGSAFLWRDGHADHLRAWAAALGLELRTWFALSPELFGAGARTRGFVSLKWRPGRRLREPLHEILALRVHDADRLRALDAPWLWEYYGEPEALLAQADAYGAWEAGDLVSAAVCAMSAGRYADLSVATAPRRRRAGAALDACASLIEHLNQRGFQPVWNTAGGHTASLSLAEKLGFVPTGTFYRLSGPAGTNQTGRPPA